VWGLRSKGCGRTGVYAEGRCPSPNHGRDFGARLTAAFSRARRAQIYHPTPVLVSPDLGTRQQSGELVDHPPVRPPVRFPSRNQYGKDASGNQDELEGALYSICSKGSTAADEMRVRGRVARPDAGWTVVAAGLRIC
jgi:hypothetical protein